MGLDISTGFKKDKLRDTPNMLGNKEKANETL